jgi:hypothetical protein
MFRVIKPPDVYVQEISSACSKPVQGVSINTPVFLVETQKGPETPTLITIWLQFQTVFGGYFCEDKFLPYLVEGGFLSCQLRSVSFWFLVLLFCVWLFVVFI